MIELGPTLVTDRLILRPPIQADFDPLAEFMADAESMRHLGGVQPASVAWRKLAEMAGSWALREFGMFSVLERDGHRWIGRVGLLEPEGWPGREVGWGLARAAWGRGYACEAASACMDWAVDQMGWRDVIHCIDPANAASIAVARRLGSQNRGPGRLPAPHEASSIDIWGQSADQWRTRRFR